MEVEKLDIQGVPALKISGEIDLHASPKLRQAMTEYAVLKSPRLVLDMSGVDYIDSSGLAVLIEYIKEAQSFGGKLGLFGLRDKVLSVFRLVGLDRFFLLEDSIENILARLEN
jgi:anti-sigma B factor antagonist